MPKTGRASISSLSVSVALPSGPGGERARAERILAISRAGTWEWELATNFNVWSDELWHLYGLDPDCGPPSYDAWRQSVLPEDREAVEGAVHEAVAKGAAFEAVWRVNGMDEGQVRWLMSKGVPVRDGDGPIVRYVGIVRDCTEWLKSEEWVYVRDVYDTIPGAFAIIDARGRLLAWNRYEAEVIIGKPDGELLGLDGFETIHPDDRDFVREKFRSVLADGIEESGEARVLFRGGPRYMWRLINGRRIFIDGSPCAIVISTDITLRRQLESLMEFRLRLFHMAEYASEAELLQATLDEAVRLTCSESAFCLFQSDMFTPEPLQAWSSGARATLESYGAGTGHGAAVNSRIWDEVRKSGAALINNDAESIRRSRGIGDDHHPISRELVVPHMNGDVLSGILGVFNREYEYDGSDASILGQLAGLAWDIVARKRAERFEKAHQEHLQQSQKMDLVGQLAGGIAHEYNNLLSIILGHTEILLDSIGGSHPIAGSLTAIQKATRRSADLTNQLLGFARRQTLLPEVIDPDRAVARFMHMMRGVAGEEISCILEPGASGAMIEIDVSQFEQVLANLFLNARDAISGSGVITITTRLHHVRSGDPDPISSGPAPGDYVVISVTDNGSGISKEHFPHIFEPFFTTKEVGKGTGLGLSTVYGIMSQNGGSVHCHTAVGQGTTVELFFSLHQDLSSSLAVEEDSAPDGAGGPTVMLVEDEPNIRKLVSDLLMGRGYRVVAAGTAEEVLVQKVPRIDLLLTDVVLPGMNGVELWLKMQDRVPGLQCLFMSGYSPQSIERKGMLEEGVNFIRKPFGIRELVDAVAGLIPSSAGGSEKN